MNDEKDDEEDYEKDDEEGEEKDDDEKDDGKVRRNTVH
jgi:hypothetical protein